MENPKTVIVIGVSAGGVEVLTALVRDLPTDLDAAILIVLHISAQAPSLLARILARAGPLPVTQAVDGEPLRSGHIYVPQPDNHVIVEQGFIRVVHGPRENRHRPSIDVLFRTAITRLIDKPVPLDDTRRDRLSKLTNSFRGQLERMNRLITDLVDVGRLQTGKMTLEKHALDLRTVVREAAEQTQMGTPDTTIRLQIEPANQPVLVNGDADRLIQIMLNLLQNAIKHANSPTIDVRLQRTNGNHDQPTRAMIEVQDYGQGIAPQHLDRLWTRFYQVEGTSSLTQTGLGLGLFIAKHLVEQHDGTIAVESQVGAGSIFRVVLPLVD